MHPLRRKWRKPFLMSSGAADSPPIEDFDAVSFAVFSGYALDMLYETVERRPAPHRAGPDTARLARGWLRAAEHQSSLQTEGKTA